MKDKILGHTAKTLLVAINRLNLDNRMLLENPTMLLNGIRYNEISLQKYGLLYSLNLLKKRLQMNKVILDTDKIKINMINLISEFAVIQRKESKLPNNIKKAIIARFNNIFNKSEDYHLPTYKIN